MSPPATPSTKPTRAWQRMLSGRRLDLLDPSPLDVEITDIAHGLARVARWNGQTVGDNAYSVAQHAILVEGIFSARSAHARREWKLAALLHDAPEYVIGDLISPFKSALGLDYKAFEHRLQVAIHRRFSLPDELPPPVQAEIKSADRIAAFHEATCLAGFSKDEAITYFGEPPPASSPRGLAHLVTPWPTATAQAQFIARFEALCSAP